MRIEGGGLERVRKEDVKKVVCAAIRGGGGQEDEGSDETTLLHLGLKMRKTAPTKCVKATAVDTKIRLRYAESATTDSARCLDRHYCTAGV